MSLTKEQLLRRSREQLEEMVRQAHLLSDEEIESIQPGNMEQAAALLRPGEPAVRHFGGRSRWDVENPDVHLLRLMRRPEFFPFTCYHLFNRPDGGGPLELLPFQHVAMNELWNRQFPLMIWTRGGSKCVRGDTLIMTDSGVVRIDALAGAARAGEPVYGSCQSVFGENGHKAVAYAWSNGEGGTVRVETALGLVLEGTGNHPVRVAGEGGVEWKELADVRAGDRIVVDRTPSWFPNTNDLPADLAYLFGVMVGDGGYTVRGSMTITSADPEMVEVCSQTAVRHFGKPFRKIPSNKYGYLLCGVKIWDRLFSEFGFNSPVCADKDVPKSVLGASKDACASFLRGLFDTDGCVTKRGDVTFCSKSERLVRTVQFLLTRFGIVSRVVARLNKKYGRYYWHLRARGDNARLFAANVGFGLRRKAERLLTNQVANTNIDTIPRPLVSAALKELIAEVYRRLGPVVHGNGKSLRKKELSAWRLEKYELTYPRLARLLEASSVAADHPAFAELKDVLDRHWYFDTVSSVSPARAVTYDLYVPDGHSFVSNGLVSHNSFCLALYALLRATFVQGSKVVITAASFRQSKAVFEYIERIWHNSPVFRSLVNSGHGSGGRNNGPRRDIDRVEFVVGDSVIIGIPMGDGQRIRGLRANYILTDEVAAINEEVYATVVQGFASVTADPVQNVKDKAQEKLLKRLGMWTRDMDAEEAKRVRGNQSVLSGTADYAFNHFYKYWKQYHDIIATRGDPKALEELFQGPVPEGFRWDAYSVLRLPYEMIPHGFMDASTIARAKQINSSATFTQEYSATFIKDSDGFFRRSLIEKCVVGRQDNPNPPRFESCGTPRFTATVAGDPQRRYVYGIDPASEADQFAVVILEQWPDHRRVVFCWTTAKSDHREKLRRKVTKDHDFYRYCVRKVRDLMKVFPCDRMLVDAGGGGVALREAFGDPLGLRKGEQPVYEVIDPDPKNAKDTDGMQGEHVLELVHFRNNDWVCEANEGLKKDMEGPVLLFPMVDSLALGEAAESDKAAGRVVVGDDGDTVLQVYDTLESCMLEIEELKNELTTIVVDVSRTGLRRWDTPDTKAAGAKRGRMRKDRYSALLMANMGARALARGQTEPVYPDAVGGFAGRLPTRKDDVSRLYHGAGSSWFNVRPESAGYGAAVRRGV